MSALAAVAGLLIAAVAIVSALAKLQREPRVVESVTHVGVPESRLPQLAALEILGALAVLAGFIVPALGIAGALGLTLYFAGAVIFHLRVGDGPDAFAVPLALTVVAALALVGRVLAG
jgi:hypothetical protein